MVVGLADEVGGPASSWAEAVAGRLSRLGQQQEEEEDGHLCLVRHQQEGHSSWAAGGGGGGRWPASAVVTYMGEMGHLLLL